MPDWMHQYLAARKTPKRRFFWFVEEFFPLQVTKTLKLKWISKKQRSAAGTETAAFILVQHHAFHPISWKKNLPQWTLPVLVPCPRIFAGLHEQMSRLATARLFKAHLSHILPCWNGGASLLAKVKVAMVIIIVSHHSQLLAKKSVGGMDPVRYWSQHLWSCIPTKNQQSGPIMTNYHEYHQPELLGPFRRIPLLNYMYSIAWKRIGNRPKIILIKLPLNKGWVYHECILV